MYFIGVLKKEATYVFNLQLRCWFPWAYAYKAKVYMWTENGS